MRAARASSVREAERRSKAVTDSANGRYREAEVEDTSYLHRPLRRQERLDLGADSTSAVGACRSTAAACTPSVIITPTPGNDRIGRTMNTLAAQTACGGGSSRSINKIGHSESNHGNIQSDTCIRDSPTSCLEEDDGSDQGVSRPCSDASLGTERSRQEMCRELEYFFMNPYLKYKKRGRKPWKLGVQLLKVIFVTVQLVVFGRSQFSLNSFYDGNREALERLFLKDWDAGYDCKAYPKSDELYAVQQDVFFKHIDHVAYQLANLEKTAIGPYSCDHSKEGAACALHVCQNYEEIKTDDRRACHSYLVIYVNTSNNISVKDYLADHNQTIYLDILRQMNLTFVVMIHLKDARTFTRGDCIKCSISIEYDNQKHNGEMSISLDFKHYFSKDCSKKCVIDVLETRGAKLTLVLVILIVALCIISTILCVRSIIKAQQLKFKTVKFFKVHQDCNLSVGDRMEFLNLWYVIIVLSDICTIAGSIINVCIPVIADDTLYVPCRLLLGSGCFLVWFGILKYLGLFNKYNILIVTLKNAMPNVLRFLICAGIIYFAYAFFGWIVLGPYHPKFETFGTTVECMFSLINGDDMFETVREMSDRNSTTYWLSRLYFYTFISLFMYVVLNLTIAIIMDTYETMKKYQRTGHIEGRLHRFMAKTCDKDIPEDIPGRGSFHTQSSMMERWRQNVTLCCRRRSSCDSDESLIT